MVEKLPLDAHLCFAVYSANIAINRAYRPTLERLGLTYPQYLVLSVLREDDGRTTSGIAERLALEPSTITPLVKRLEGLGLVVRARNPMDERQVFVSLTPQGIALHEDAACLAGTLLTQSGLQVQDIIRLNRDIAALRDALVANAPEGA